jgi:hypothetical protein
MRNGPPRPPGPRGNGKRKVESADERRERKRKAGRPDPPEEDHDDPRQLVADTVTVTGVPPIPRPCTVQKEADIRRDKRTSRQRDPRICQFRQGCIRIRSV